MIWTEVSIEVATSQAESAAAIVLRHCPNGFEEMASRSRRRLIRAYVVPGRQALARLRQEVRRVAPSARFSTRRVCDETWQDAWKAHARPIRIGRLTVLPTWWGEPQKDGAVLVRLDPGMAFGSGAHPSTRLCLAALERHVAPGMSVIDVGTGSGVLAIAAARLGAGRVLAIDSDPIALDVARENTIANRVGARVVLYHADSLARVRATADLIVANLTSATLPPFLADIRRLLKRGGRLIASGFGALKERAVRADMEAAGLRPVEVDRFSRWCAVHAIPAYSRRTGRRGSRRPARP